jgi:hypothetical protein
MGKAIAKTITIVEIIKRRIPGLHQVCSATPENHIQLNIDNDKLLLDPYY